MELKLLSMALLLTVLLASTQAVITPEQYWKLVLPSARMPNAIKDILYSTYTSTNEEPVKDWIDPKRDDIFINYKSPPHQDTSTNEEPVNDWIDPKRDDFFINYKSPPHHEPIAAALFLLEKDLKPGKTVTLNNMKSSNGVPFLPRQVADTKPFSSTRLPEIYSMYSVKPGSVEAEVMKDTINECEAPGIEGEEKYCATSLESMIDVTKSKLGKYMKAISTEVSKRTPKQKYTIKEEARRVTVTKSVACHKKNYPYAVFYCHETQRTRLYMVAMEGSDGSSVKAVVACHTDTSKWSPKHVAFKVLKVEPGTVPICHFLPEDHIVWFSN